MAGMGRVPKAGARHRGNDTLATALVWLPASGRDGEPPIWPLTAATKAEAKVWSELWATPQACVWEELGWARVVARYTRVLIKAERPGASGAVLSEVRQMEDRLGLTPMSMLRLRWGIEPDEEEPAGELLEVDAERWQKLGA